MNEMQKLEGASTVLTMGILSIVLTVLCCGPFGAIFSIIGLIKARNCREMYEQNPDVYVNYDQVKTGKILSYIGLGIAVVYLLITILYFGAIAAVISSGEWNF